jgi:hypothetical protein
MEEQATTATSRHEMVEAARQFFLNPKVRSTPFEEQKKFLREKGCTDMEIDEALAGISPVEVAALSSVNSSPPPPFPAQPTSNRFISFTQSALIVGGASFMAYKLVRSWLLPKFFDIPDPAQEQLDTLHTQMDDLQNTTKYIMESVAQTLETVSAQQEQLNRALVLMSHNGSANGGKDGDMQRLQSDLTIVKSLLLNQNQFAPIPNGNPKNVHIPSWQMTKSDDQNKQNEDPKEERNEGSSV